MEKEKVLKVGDVFWEYNDVNTINGVGYPRHAHSQSHVNYFYKRYGTVTFFTKEELLKAHPKAIVD